MAIKLLNNLFLQNDKKKIHRKQKQKPIKVNMSEFKLECSISDGLNMKKRKKIEILVYFLLNDWHLSSLPKN